MTQEGADRRRISLAEMIVVGVVLAALVAAAAIFVPFFHHDDRRMTCMSNVAQLAALYRQAVEEKRFDPKLHGSAQILSWLDRSKLPPGAERVFVCPGDNIALPETPEEAARYRVADPRAVVPGLLSYAVRDFERFPIDPASKEKQIILCDRQGANGRTMHHKNVIVVAYADGDTQKMDREALGVDPKEPIVVGPESPIPVLRELERP